MRRLPVLFLVASLALVALPARAAPALLDPAFGGDGIVTAFPDGAIATAVGIDDLELLAAAVGRVQRPRRIAGPGQRFDHHALERVVLGPGVAAVLDVHP